MTTFLLIVGTILLCIEIFMPGFGICGFVGLTFLISGTAITLLTVPFGFLIPAVQIAIVVIVAVSLYKYLRKKQLYGKLILNDFLAFEKKDLGNIEALIGKVGLTKTALRPQGTADFNGIISDVHSTEGYIPEGTKIKVVSVSENKLFVTRVHSN